MNVSWITIVFTILCIGCVYVGLRLIVPAKIGMMWKVIAWTGLILLFALPVASSFLMRRFENLTDPLSWIAYTSLGFLSFVFTFLVIRDVVWLIALGAVNLYALGQKLTSHPPVQLDPSRRNFLLQVTNVGVLGVAASLTGYGIYQARRKPGIVEITVPITRLPKEFSDFRIVQITDIHAGLTVRRDWIEVVVNEVKQLKPDLIAFTGDLADGSVPHLRSDVEPFAELEAPHGKFFITGNHEYYSGVEQWVEEARRLGYDVLLNEHRLIQRNGASIVLAGVTDYSGGQFLPSHKSDPRAAIHNAPQDRPRILLAHQPRSLYQAESLGYDLMISGHTHGGQFFPWNLVATLGQPYIKGLHDHNGTWVYVSKGTGYWGPPVRLGARSEITVITLTNNA
ncbi:MAG TPA: metallophosphoesterase [Bacteroidota bacterium]|jgi:predicted MPP superfamily phosphohydrolase|nr:metallophosphoesterase [Bacteroidota bacterium]